MREKLKHFVVTEEVVHVQFSKVAEGPQVVEEEVDKGRLGAHGDGAGETAQTSRGALRHLLPQPLERQAVAAHAQVTLRQLKGAHLVVHQQPQHHAQLQRIRSLVVKKVLQLLEYGLIHLRLQLFSCEIK